MTHRYIRLNVEAHEDPRDGESLDLPVIRPATIGGPLPDELIILRAAVLGSVAAEEVIFAAQRDDGVAGLLVAMVRGDLVFLQLWHYRAPKKNRKTETSVFISVFGPLCRTSAGALIQRSANVFLNSGRYRTRTYDLTGVIRAL